MSKGCGPLGPKTPPSLLPDGGNSIYDYQTPGSYFTCWNQVSLDITQDIDRYLLDNFVAGVEDRSTINDLDHNNRNYKLYGVTHTSRYIFSLSEASTDVPAQKSREMYNPTVPVKFCNICPKSIPLEISPDSSEWNNLKNFNSSKPAAWKTLTDNYIGRPGLNTSLGESNQSLNDTIWKNWADNSTHKQYGCYSI